MRFTHLLECVCLCVWGGDCVLVFGGVGVCGWRTSWARAILACMSATAAVCALTSSSLDACSNPEVLFRVGEELTSTKTCGRSHAERGGRGG